MADRALKPNDTRGILAPREMLRHVDYMRYPALPELGGLVSWCWSVSWDLPGGFTHAQQVLPHPQVNCSVGNPPPDGAHPPPGPYALRSVVNGVGTGLSTRVLVGTGWNLAVKTTTGGFGAWVDDVRTLNDRGVPMDDVLNVDSDRLASSCAEMPLAEAATHLQFALLGLLETRDPTRVALAREVARVAEVAEHDRQVRRVDDLARLAGVTARTLQRMFVSCAGVSPTWVIRRFRLIDAAELVREGQDVDWAEAAPNFGYADQAHLTRDFTRVIGQAPGGYARAMRAAAAG